MTRSPPPTCNSSSFPTTSDSEVSDNHLQPFFVLHKAHWKNGKKSCALGNTRRRADLPLSSSNSSVQEENEAIYERLRLEAFDLTWSMIDSTVKEVLREINMTLFDEVRLWVFEHFSTIKYAGPSEIMKPYPTATSSTCKRVPTALVFTKNIEFVDDVLTFQDLMVYLNSNGCHAAYLSALDLSIKHGVGICVNSLCRQLFSEVLDTVDISSIASWYCQPENYQKPIVVIIPGMEVCDGAVLADFIKLISEWIMKIPVFFIMGVASSFDAPRKLLPSSVLHNLQPFKFTLEAPGRRMDSLIEAVLVRSFSGFFIGHKVAIFLRNYFIRHDGTVTSFSKALKLACVKHFIREPLSFLCPGMLHENGEAFWRDRYETLPEALKSYAFDLKSCQNGKYARGNNFAQGLLELKRQYNSWSAVVLCLFEVGKLSKIQLLEIFCQAIEPVQLLPELNASLNADAKDFSVNGRLISQVIQKARDLPSESLNHLLSRWSLHVKEITEVAKKLRDLREMIKLSHDGHTSAGKSVGNIHRPLASSSMGKGTPSMNNEAAMLLAGMVRNFLAPIESSPFHEIVCFRDVTALKSALTGDPRGVVQDDLLKSDEHLQCNHDTAIMYNLAQEYDDLINLHDWYNSFKAKIMTPSTKTKRKVQRTPSSPASKRGKCTSLDKEATTQARFCKAVTDLQITGLVQMPSGACEYGPAVGMAPFSSMIAAGGPSLFYSGLGCGACYQVKCTSNAACSGHPVTVVIADSCPGGPCASEPVHFDLSGTAFGAMAHPGQADQLRNAGTLQIQFQRVPCSYAGETIVFHVQPGTNPEYFAVVPLYVNGDGNLKAVKLLPAGSGAKWLSMQHMPGVGTWSLNYWVSPLLGPFSLSLTSSTGKTLTAENVIPADWKPELFYKSQVNF